jgi:hypothetical protein
MSAFRSARMRTNDKVIAGRSPLRLTTFSLPTHREVVAAAFGFPLLGAPSTFRSPRLPCVPCRVSAFHAAAIRQMINDQQSVAQDAPSDSGPFIHNRSVGTFRARGALRMQWAVQQIVLRAELQRRSRAGDPVQTHLRSCLELRQEF